MSEIFRLPSEFSLDVAKTFNKVIEGLRLGAYRCSIGVWIAPYNQEQHKEVTKQLKSACFMEV